MLISLLLAFGTPLYRVIFFDLPGFNQIHSPFRWLIPYTAAMAMLAGIGFDLVRARLSRWRWTFAAIGLAALVGVVVWKRLILPRAHVPAADLGLENRNYAIFAVLLVAIAAICWLGRRRFGPLAVLLVLADLAYFGINFNTASSLTLLQTTPASIRFLQQDHSLFRVTGFGADKVFEPNGNMLYDLQDARGYDSVIVGRYARFNNLIESQDQLQYNRVKTLDKPEALDSPLLALLNVKYVVSTQTLNNSKYQLVFDQPELKVYQNLSVLPRAFVVPSVRFIADDAAQLDALRSPAFDPTRVAIVDRSQPAVIGGATFSAADIQQYSGRKVTLQASGPGLLVLTDNNFPGWKVTVDGQKADIITADYAFRGVALEAGSHRVDFTFTPDSLVLGGLVSGLSAALIALILVFYGWLRYVRRSPAVQMRTASRVTKNAISPMASNLVTKLMSFGFTIYYFPHLGLGQVGKYGTAVAVNLLMDTVISFGLQQMVMRDVARDKAAANAYITNATAVRLAVTAVVGLPVVAAALVLSRFFGLPGDTAAVIIILTLSFVPGAFANIFSHVFDAFELMEYRSMVNVLTGFVTIVLGLIFIQSGANIVGLAVASLLTNIFTAAVFYMLLSRTIVRPSFRWSGSLVRHLVTGAFPIMLNQLLVVVFFKIDVPILGAFRKAEEVGLYTTAYKFVDAMLIVPPAFIQAVFPIISRQAVSQRDSLQRGFDLSLKALLLVAFPAVAAFEVLADAIIQGFYGSQFAAAAPALRILILFLPFSYVNGLTQYVLIALDKQRTIIRFFGITAVFNILVNLALIPSLGYIAASIVTVASEVVLLVPLYWLTARELDHVSIGSVAAKPLLGSLVAAAVMLLVRVSVASHGPVLTLVAAIVLGAASYFAALVVLRTFTPDEVQLVRGVLNRRRLEPALTSPAKP